MASPRTAWAQPVPNVLEPARPRAAVLPHAADQRLSHRTSHNPEAFAFTFMELLVVIGVIAILAGILAVGVSKLRARAQRVQCMANLRSLHAGANLYLQQNGAWPQIFIIANRDKPEEELAQLWIEALEPSGVPRKTWICPTTQQSLGNPDYSRPENTRLDYIPVPFDDKPTTPHEWPQMPWFIERGDAHGNGNLIIFTDGSIVASSEIKVQ